MHELIDTRPTIDRLLIECRQSIIEMLIDCPMRVHCTHDPCLLIMFFELFVQSGNDNLPSILRFIPPNTRGPTNCFFMSSSW